MLFRSLATTDYCTKWVEARALKDNSAKSVARFLYEAIMTRYRCPVELVTDQGGHFINAVLRELVTRHMIIHKKSMVYYPRANGQAESSNKILLAILKKLVNENRTDWDEKPHILHFGHFAPPIRLLQGLRCLNWSSELKQLFLWNS